MYNDADIGMLELEDASRWMYCSDCGDEVRRRDGETRCKRCSDTPPPAKLDDTTTYADEHECGQLRIAVPGEQVSLLPLPDSLIPVLASPYAEPNPIPPEYRGAAPARRSVHKVDF